MADFRATAMSGSLTKLVDGTDYLIAGANIDITTGSNGSVRIDGTGGGGSSEWTRAAGDLYPTTTPTTTDVIIGASAVANADIILGATGGAIFNEQGNSVDLRVQTAARENALLVKGASNQVLIMSGGAAASDHEAGGTDVLFYVSGTVGSEGTLTRGASLFGGDTVISGSLKVFNRSVSGGTISGSIHHTEDGLSYLIAGDGITIASGSNGQITITNDGTVGDITAIIAGAGLTGGGNSGDVTVDVDYAGTDNFIDACPNNLEGTAIAAGDTIVYHDADDDDVKKGFVSDLPFLSNVVEDTTPELGGQLVTGDHKIAFATGDNTSEIDFTYNGGGNFTAIASVKSIDMFLDSNGGDSGQKFRIFNNLQPTSAHAGGTNTDANAIFMVREEGNVFTKGYVTASMGLSGSLTRLTDGTSYLVAGPNITIYSASNGQVTIESTGGSSEWTDGGGANGPLYPSDNAGRQDIITGGTSVAGADIILGFDGRAVFNESGDPVDFRVETSAKESALLIDGSTDQVLILSGGAKPSPDEAAGGDVAFYVSGSIGSRGSSSERGVSLFGGDVVHSGSVTILDPGGSDENLRLVRGPSGNNYITFEEPGGVNVGQIYANSANLFIKGASSGNDLIFRVGSTNVLRMDGATERIGIGTDLASPTHMLHVSGTQTNGFRVDTGDRENTILAQGERVLILSGGAKASPSESDYPDVNFFVSGTIGSRETAVKGTSLFGGDVNISGSLVVGENRQSSGHGLEVSGSSRAGAGTSGRLEYIYGCFDYQLENSQPRFLPLAKSFEIHDTLGNQGKRGSMMEFINPPHNGVVKEVRLALSGADGNTNNPGNTQIAFYCATTSTPNLHSINQVGPGLTFAAAPTGFVRDVTGANNINNDDGQTWVFTWSNEPFITKDRLFGLAVGLTLGPSNSAAYHCTYTVVMEYNEFT